VQKVCRIDGASAPVQLTWPAQGHHHRRLCGKYMPHKLCNCCTRMVVGSWYSAFGPIPLHGKYAVPLLFA